MWLWLTSWGASKYCGIRININITKLSLCMCATLATTEDKNQNTLIEQSFKGIHSKIYSNIVIFLYDTLTTKIATPIPTYTQYFLAKMNFEKLIKSNCSIKIVRKFAIQHAITRQMLQRRGASLMMNALHYTMDNRLICLCHAGL